MTTAEKKSKRKGIIGTILFHAFLLAAFLFMGLTYQDPLLLRKESVLTLDLLMKDLAK